MEQELFEAAIKDYVVKNIDSDNDQLVTYRLKRSPKCIIYRIGGDRVSKGSLENKPMQIKPAKLAGIPPTPILTPQGRFVSVAEGAQALGITRAMLYRRLRERQEGYFYEE
jgi:hypothetical protein